ARSTPRAHEHVHRTGEERKIRDREEPRRHRSERDTGPNRRWTRQDGRCGLMIRRSLCVRPDSQSGRTTYEQEEAVANGSALRISCRGAEENAVIVARAYEALNAGDFAT